MGKREIAASLKDLKLVVVSAVIAVAMTGMYDAVRKLWAINMLGEEVPPGESYGILVAVLASVLAVLVPYTIVARNDGREKSEIRQEKVAEGKKGKAKGYFFKPLDDLEKN